MKDQLVKDYQHSKHLEVVDFCLYRFFFMSSSEASVCVDLTVDLGF